MSDKEFLLRNSLVSSVNIVEFNDLYKNPMDYQLSYSDSRNKDLQNPSISKYKGLVFSSFMDEVWKSLLGSYTEDTFHEDYSKFLVISVKSYLTN